MAQNSKNPVLVILAFIAIYVIWGSTYLLNKIAVTELDPFMLAAIRFIVSGCLIFIIAIISGRSIAITKKQAVNTAIAGFLFLSFGNGGSGMGIEIRRHKFCRFRNFLTTLNCTFTNENIPGEKKFLQCLCLVCFWDL